MTTAPSQRPSEASPAGSSDTGSQPALADLRRLTTDIATAEWRAVDTTAMHEPILSLHLHLDAHGQGRVSLRRPDRDEQPLAVFMLPEAALARWRTAERAAATDEIGSAPGEAGIDPPVPGNDFETIAARLDAALADSAEPVGSPGWPHDNAGWIDDTASAGVTDTVPGHGRRRRHRSSAAHTPQEEDDWPGSMPTSDAARHRPRRSGALTLLVLLLLAGVGGAWWYLNNDPRQLPDFLHQPLRMLGVLPAETPDGTDPGGIWSWQTLEPDPAPDTLPVEPESSRSEAAATPAEAVGNEPVPEIPGESDTSVAPPETSASAVEAADTEASAAEASAAEAADAEAADAEAADAEAADAETATVPDTVELTLQFDADCWVEVSDASGQRLLFELAPAGQTRTVEGPLPFTLAFGNAQEVSLRLNGTPIAAERYLPESGSVVRFRLLRDPEAEAGVSVASPEAAVDESATTVPATDPAAAVAVASAPEAPSDPVAAPTESAAVPADALLIRGARPGVSEGELLRVVGSGSFDGRVRTLQLGDPPRGVIDIMGAELAVDATAASAHPDVLRVRLGRHEDRVRIVLDLREQRTVAAVADGDQLIVR